MAQFKITEQDIFSRAVVAGERLWLAEDGETIVADGDARAASLYATPGQEINREDAVRYGLVKPTKDEKPVLAAETAAEEKTAAEILADVGDDADKARLALEAEQASDKPRKTLVAKLESVAASGEEA
jgi:hypothetical protein